MTSKGHTTAHMAHPMQRPGSTNTTPRTSSRVIAPGGADLLTRRRIAVAAPVGEGRRGDGTRLPHGPACAGRAISRNADIGSWQSECSMAQAISHWRQPMQRSGLTKTLRTTTSSPRSEWALSLALTSILKLDQAAEQGHWS